MRLAVLSDIHGNLLALEAALNDLQASGPFDEIWCLGDLAAFGPRPAECVQRVRQLQEEHGEKKFRCIGGNTDRYLVTGERANAPAAADEEAFQRRVTIYKERDDVLNWNLAQLSYDDYAYLAKIVGRELRRRVPGYGDLIGVHAAPGDDDSLALKPDSTEEEARDALLDREGRMIAVGHTHYQMERRLGHWHLVNPGSVGVSFSQPGKAEWAIVTVDAGTLRVDLRAVPFDREQVIADGKENGHPHPALLTHYYYDYGKETT